MRGVSKRIQRWVRRFRRRHPVPAWVHALVICFYIPVYAYFFGMENMHVPDTRSQAVIATSQLLYFYLAIFIILPRAFRYKRHPAINALWVVIYVVLIWVVISLLLLGISLATGAIQIRWESRGQWLWDIANFGLIALLTCYFAMAASVGYQLVAQLLIVNRHKDNLRQLVAHKRNVVGKLELEWRRAQLDPHMLAGLLTRVRLMSQLDKQTTWKALNRIIHIMRYYCAIPPGTDAVPIEDEMEQVRNLLALEKLGKNKLHYTINYQVQAQGLVIIPMLLLMLVENQLKYGLLTELSAPAVLDISDGRKPNVLSIQTLNRVKKVADGTKNVHSGQGLANISARLKHYYDRYDFAHGLDDDGRYRVEIALFLGN